MAISNKFQVRELRSRDDILREVAEKRIERTFGNLVPEERMQMLEHYPDLIEDGQAFEEAALQAGISDTKGLLGFSQAPEIPAHIHQAAAATELATLIHEDLHRLTAPETRDDLVDHGELNEGLTEYFTHLAMEDLSESGPPAYEEEVKQAEIFVETYGKQEVEEYYFRH